LIDEQLRAAVQSGATIAEVQPQAEQVETVIAPPQPVADWSFNG
jgi:hypothetical protein